MWSTEESTFSLNVSAMTKSLLDECILPDLMGLLLGMLDPFNAASVIVGSKLKILRETHRNDVSFKKLMFKLFQVVFRNIKDIEGRS